MFGLDCEMVTTARGLELARVTVVNQLHKVVYDSLCKPENEITNYNTKWSGITEDMLKNVKKNLKTVQQELCSIMHREDILVGHSLENDLLALNIVHTRVIDTAVLYPHPRGPPYKNSLRKVVEKYLNRAIQVQNDEQTEGHDSTEDAIAALELAQLKIKNGPRFGVEDSRCQELFKILHGYRKTMALYANSKVLRMLASPVNSVSAVDCKDDDQQVLKKAAAGVTNGKYQLSVCHLTSFANPPSTAKLKKLDEGLMQLFKCAPRNTLFIVTTSQGPSHEVQALNQEQLAATKKGISWPLEKSRALKIAHQKARSGVVFATIKRLAQGQIPIVRVEGSDSSK
mmetsp:Transcript_8493/g.12018  ORF Transcript_8493/g.12018 Transcript_8493/m.12018 type:complete len:342 (-) Transcript_8493:37-1062(-)